MSTRKVRFPLHNDYFVQTIFAVVNAYVPFLIRLDILWYHQFNINTNTNSLESCVHKCTLLITYKFRHASVDFSPYRILLTRSELRRLHLHFMHLSADELIRLLWWALPRTKTLETEQIIGEISDACATCQEYRPSPLCFRTCIFPDKVIFNYELAIDIMLIDEVPILHIADSHTHFQNAVVSRSRSVQESWNAFIECWATVYI